MKLISSSGKSLVDCRRGSYVSLGHCVTAGLRQGQATPSHSRSSCSPFSYRAGPGVGDAPFVFHPAVVESLLVCEGAAEGGSHGSHGVDADGRATEDAAVGKHRALSVPAAPRGPGADTATPLSPRCPLPALEPCTAPRGWQESLWHSQSSLGDH